MADEKTETLKLNMSKFSLAADYYATTVPAISRIYIKELDKLRQQSGLPSTPANQCCRYCSTLFRPGNHKVKFLRKMRLNKKIKRLIERKAEKGEHSLGKFQQKLLQCYLNSTTRVAMTCGTCEKKTVIACPSKPEKLTDKDPGEEVMETKVTKAAKKKLKQKKRRIEKAKESLQASGVELPLLKSKSLSNTATTSKAVISKPSVPPIVVKKANPVQSLSSVQNHTKKKKGKDFNQTLQRMLNKEQLDKSKSKSSLHSFLSSL